MRHFTFIGTVAGAILCAAVTLTGCNGQQSTDLPRGEASEEFQEAFSMYIEAAEASEVGLHSVMVVQHGKVIAEQWLSEGDKDTPHIMNSVSKTFTATAVGFAVNEGLLSLEDKVISFFPDKLPEEISDNLAAMSVRDLLTMSCGHDVDPTAKIRKMPEDADWVEMFLAEPVDHEPGTFFVYNSVGTYMLSAIVQKVTGEKIFDYLTPRLWEPLGIDGIWWEESPQGINCGGWGLYLKTEDMAKMGQLFLQKGVWNGKQIVPQSWIEEATAKHIDSLPAGIKAEQLTISPEDSDWLQGYCYQMWRCRHNAVRADGANGQYIIIIPDKDAVVVNTAHVSNMQEEINLIWNFLLPAL